MLTRHSFRNVILFVESPTEVKPKPLAKVKWIKLLTDLQLMGRRIESGERLYICRFEDSDEHDAVKTLKTSQTLQINVRTGYNVERRKQDGALQEEPALPIHMLVLSALVVAGVQCQYPEDASAFDFVSFSSLPLSTMIETG